MLRVRFPAQSQTKYKIQHSSLSHHHSSPNLIIHYILLQNWQNPFTVEMYRTINLSCLFKITARQVSSEVALTIFHYINTPSFKKFHTKAVKGTV